MRLTLETKRLLLRPWLMKDAKDMFLGWASDPQVAKYVTWEPHSNIEVTKTLLSRWVKEYKQKERINCAIELKRSGTLIGGIDVVRYQNGYPVIGYNIARKYWNHGYMTEACKCLIDYLFSRGYKQIIIEAVPENHASIRVIEKCGGQYVKTYQDNNVLKDICKVVSQYVIKNKNI